jgi:hypothetical protein
VRDKNNKPGWGTYGPRFSKLINSPCPRVSAIINRAECSALFQR